MTPDANASGDMDFIDRKTGLVVFGILEILLGILCALVVGFLLLATLAAWALEGDAGQSFDTRMMLPSILPYVMLTVGFIWLGIGSIMARRWARALLLITSWFWLIVGILAIVFIILFSPTMFGQMGEAGEVPGDMVVVMMGVTIGVLAVFYIMIPGALVLFYRSEHVKATCEHRDPHIRWTDKCPLPVLAVSIWVGISAAGMPTMGIYNWTIPFFGIVLTGMAGALVILLSLCVLVYAAWGMYRLNIQAWRCVVIMIIAWAVSSALTFWQVGIVDYYEKMNLPVEQMEVMRQYGETMMSPMLFLGGLSMVAALVFLFYTKRYFVSPHAVSPGVSAGPA